jgi:K+-transporting ATPase KdpF subunit
MTVDWTTMLGLAAALFLAAYLAVALLKPEVFS